MDQVAVVVEVERYVAIYFTVYLYIKTEIYKICFYGDFKFLGLLHKTFPHFSREVEALMMLWS